MADARLSETTRVEAFSDGVFAIAITLLILEIRMPHVERGHSLGQALLAQWPSYIAFLTSFATIGIMWMNHHRIFTLIGRADQLLIFLNGLLLLGVTFIPFPTMVLADYIGSTHARTAAIFYSATFLVTAIFFNILWRYAASREHLIDAAADRTDVKAISDQYRYGPLFYLVALVAAFFSPLISVLINVGLALFFAIPAKRKTSYGT